MKHLYLLLSVALLGLFCNQASGQMLPVKGGEYVPLYGKVTETRVQVKSFLMDVQPVTMAEYAAFLEANPKWKKSQVKRLFADQNYLKDWVSDLDFGIMNPNRPVNNVSWYAAKAYCECLGKRLPTVDEWEYAAMASPTMVDARRDSLYNVGILSSYETPKTFMKEVGKSTPNIHGIKDLHGLVWEWTSDFNSIMMSGNNRSGENDRQLFCAAGSYGATDLMNYAAFMRYALRSSVKANYSLTNMGFRCVKDINAESKNNQSL